MIFIRDFKYFQSSSKIETGVKGGRRPPKAIYGKNGTFRVVDSPVVMVYLSDNMSFDAYGILKFNTCRRITEKFAREVLGPLIGKNAQDRDEIINMIVCKVKDISGE